MRIFFVVTSFLAAGAHGFLWAEEGISINEKCGGARVVLYSDCKLVKLRDDQGPIDNPMCESQKFVFFSGGKRVSVLTHAKKNIYRSVHEKKIKALDMVVSGVGCFRAKSGYIVGVSSYGGCNACGEWFGMYSVGGRLLWDSDGDVDEKVFLDRQQLPRNWRHSLVDIEY